MTQSHESNEHVRRGAGGFEDGGACDDSRRDFLKKALVGSLYAVGAITLVNTMAEPAFAWHSDEPHYDSAHADQPHQDVAHADVDHADVAHGDCPSEPDRLWPHVDSPHADNYDHADSPHTDNGHLDTQHADQDHMDHEDHADHSDHNDHCDKIHADWSDHADIA